jgi:hypothetical protein
MTAFPLPSGRSINLEAVTFAERATWVERPHADERHEYSGVIVHFIGGSRLKLTGTDAIVAAKEFRL